jgi:hypothetical protein
MFVSEPVRVACHPHRKLGEEAAENERQQRRLRWAEGGERLLVC